VSFTSASVKAMISPRAAAAASLRAAFLPALGRSSRRTPLPNDRTRSFVRSSDPSEATITSSRSRGYPAARVFSSFSAMTSSSLYAGMTTVRVGRSSRARIGRGRTRARAAARRGKPAYA
jgi:hypothetical protein